MKILPDGGPFGASPPDVREIWVVARLVVPVARPLPEPEAKAVLEGGRRDLVLRFVRSAPGCTMREASKATRIYPKALFDICNSLAAESSILMWQSEGSIRLIPHQPGLDDAACHQVAVLHDDSTQALHAFLSSQEFCKPEQLVQFQRPSSRAATQRRLRSLARAGLAEQVTAPGSTRPQWTARPALAAATKILQAAHVTAETDVAT